MKSVDPKSQTSAIRRRIPKLTRARLGCMLALTAGVLCPRPASATLTLTGLSVYSVDASGNFTNQDLWDTRGAGAYVAWMYGYDGSTSFVNGPTYLSAGISVPLTEGDHYFAIYGQPGTDPGRFGISMFFNSNTTSPGISVYSPSYSGGPSTPFTIDGSSSTPSLQGPPSTTLVPAANSFAFVTGGFAVTINDFSWQTPSYYNQDHVTNGTNSPGQGADFFGYIEISVFPVDNDFVWWGGGSNSNWGTGNNWTNDAYIGFPPGNDNPGTANVIFDGNDRTSPQANVPWNVASIDFDRSAANFTLDGQQLTIGAGGITNDSNNLQAINNPIVLAGSQTWNAASGGLLIGGSISLGGNTLTVTGAWSTTISGSIGGSGALIKDGAGTTLALSHANTYTGGTTVNAGILAAEYGGNDGQSCVGPSLLTINNGGTVRVDANNALGRGANLPPIMINSGGTLTVVTLQSQHLMSLTLNGGTLASEPPGGSGIGFGTFDLDNNLIAGGAAATSTISALNIALTTPGGTTFTVTPGATSGIDLDVIGSIGAPPFVANTGLIKAGLGTMRLDSVNSYIGGTTVNAGILAAAYGSNDGQSCVGQSLLTINNGGTVRVDANNALGRGANLPPIVINAGGTLTVVTFQSQHLQSLMLHGGTLTSETPGASGVSFGTFDLDNNLTAGGSTTTSIISALNLALTTTGGTTFTVNPGATNGIDLDVTGTIGAPTGVTNTGLIKAGAGVMRLSNNNTYGGGTTVSAGTLAVNGSILGPVVVNSGATLQGTGTIGGLVTVNSGGTFSPGNSPGKLTVGALTLASGSQTNIELGATQYDQVDVAGQLTLGGALNLILYNGFQPAAGSSLHIFDWGTLSGAFSSVQLPALPSTMAWSSLKLYSAGLLSVVDTNFQPGDWNRDHQITTADIPAMLDALTNLAAYQANNQNMSDAQLNAIGDLDGLNGVTNADIQPLLDLIAASGGGAAQSVPEPASILLLALALPAFAGFARRVRPPVRRSLQ